VALRDNKYNHINILILLCEQSGQESIHSIYFCIYALNPNISIVAESPVDVQEVFVGSETMDGVTLKYPRGKAEIRLQRV
tara:strand:- start:727 stop:966 length:240 start_codon:yes stop_codon:yes gene_type:complete